MRSKTVQAKLVKEAPASIIDKVRNAKDLCFSEDNYVKGYHFSHQYIGNIISQGDVDRWNGQTPVCIAAQTGTGKSSFVFDKILVSVKNRAMRLCIIGSRTVLVQQYKKQAANLEDPDLLKELTEEGFQTRHNFGSIDIYSYQEIIYMLSKNPMQFFSEYGAIVLDECHFFTQDATYNELSQEILESIITSAQHCLRIYLTATPDVCLEDIIKLEKKYSNAQLSCLRGSATDGFFNKSHLDNFLLYYFDINYDYITPCFFKEDSEIVDIIQADRSNAKYLICVDSKARGQSLEQALGKSIAEFIDAELKNTLKSEVVSSMINKEQFEKKVLIATSFLDVGINLKDQNLLNVVIYSTDQTHFLQSIGRKRKQIQQAVSLYIHIPNQEDISRHLKKARFKQVELMENIRFYCDLTTAYYLELPDSIYLKKKDGRIQIKYNGFAFTYLEHRVNELTNMLDSLRSIPNSDEAFARHFLSWLGLEHLYEQIHWLGNSPTDKNELVQLIENYTNREMAEEEFKKFRKEFQETYNRLYPQTSIRDGRTPHLKTLNKKFNELGLALITSNIGNAGNPSYIIKKG